MTRATEALSPDPTSAMSDQRVDYDQIAPTYNRRYAANNLGQVAEALLALTEKVSAERVLEVGCGTGRWLADLTDEPRQLWGLDASIGMLRQARWRPVRLDLVQGRAAQTAFRDAAFDLVFCVNAIHHFDDPVAFVHEAHRLLRPGGKFLCIDYLVSVLGFQRHGFHCFLALTREEWVEMLLDRRFANIQMHEMGDFLVVEAQKP